MRRLTKVLLLAGVLCSIPMETSEASWWSFWRQRPNRNPPPPTNPKPPAPPTTPPTNEVPEINAGSAAMGCAILFGVSLIVADRLRVRNVRLES